MRRLVLFLTALALIGIYILEKDMALHAAPNAIVNEALPRPEYPRPDFRRDTWLNLNGVWDFRIDPDDTGLSQRWFDPASDAIAGRIVVPFPWQSELSGVQNLVHRGVAWYRRTFHLPEGWNSGRTVLHFGAVDYWADVWINGAHLGRHEGGYTPFEFDISDALVAGENVIVVRVDDPADLREIPHGKQRGLPPNPWDDVSFTTTSGIWQTVWLESRPAGYVARAHITPDVPGQRATLDVDVYVDAPGSWSLSIAVTAPDGITLPVHEAAISAVAAGMQTLHIDLPIPDPLLWDIRQPNLYDVTLQWQPVGGAGRVDVLHTYFGMRSIEARGQQVLLNGRPVFLMSALDQGYWPDGLYTAPSDDALRYDIEYALRVGFNGLRKHIKIEDPRFAYWADRLGLLLWCDAPSPVTFSALAQQRLQRDLQGMIARDYNHPSIVVWSPYNESWGLEFRSNRDVREYLSVLYDRIKAWDRTRLVVDNSGWRHVRTDIADSHKYTGDPVEWRGFMTLLANDPMTIEVLGHPFFASTERYEGQPLMITEYATGWREDRSWGFKWQTDEIRRHANISGYTYTELYDIEHEYAGFMLYDRTPKDFGYDPAMINSPDYVTLDYRQSPHLTPGESLSVDVYVSAYGLPAWSGGMLRWCFQAEAPDAESPLAEGEQQIAVAPYTVTQVQPIELDVPAATGAMKLWVEVSDAQGKLRARNYLDFEIMGEPLPLREEIPARDGMRYTARLPLADADGAFSPLGPLATPRLRGSDVRPVLIGRDTGYVELRAPLPSNSSAWQHLSVEAEVASLPPANFVTMALEGRGFPTHVEVRVNGVLIDVWDVPDRPVNALGVLTRINGLGPGEHGFWMTAQTRAPETLAAIQEVARAEGELVIRFDVPPNEPRGGLTLFGSRGGRYGRDPLIAILSR